MKADPVRGEGARSALLTRSVLDVNGSDSSPSLIWLKVSTYMMETECRRYRCRKFNANELTDDKGNLMFAKPAWRYRLYGPDGLQIGQPQSSFPDVQQLAETAA